MEHTQIWWTRVPTAIKLVDDAAQALQAWRTVAVSNELGAWGESFIDTVLERIQQEVYSIAFYEIDLSVLDPSTSILDGLADSIGIGYMTGRTIKELAPELPEGGCIWRLTGVSRERQSELEALLRQISQCKAQLAFLYQRPTTTKAKSCLNAEIEPTRFDLQYYALTLLMGTIPNYLLEYACALSVELSMLQPEHCAALCENILDCLHEPESAADWMPETERISRIHTAQLKVIEPCIERGRLYFIHLLGERLEHILPFQDEYGSTFSRPVEVELRNMIYERNRLDLTFEEKAFLNRLYDARNKISHLELLDFKTADSLLSESTGW